MSKRLFSLDKLFGRDIQKRLREIKVDRAAFIVVRFIFAYLRCLFFLRRKGFVMSGARVRYAKSFYNEGLFTLETGSLIDCYSDDGLRIGQNFKLGRNSIISLPGSFLSKGSTVEIGNNVGIGDFSYIGGEAPVKIGSDTISGQYLSVHPENHTLTNSDLFRESKTSKQGIEIGSNVWIGAKVTVLDGSIIGDNTIIAAGAVVNGQFPSGSVIAGVPAKLIRKVDD